MKIVSFVGLQVGPATADQPGDVLSGSVASLRQFRGNRPSSAFGHGRSVEHAEKEFADGLVEVRELQKREQGVPVLLQRRLESKRESGSHSDARVILAGAQPSGRGTGTVESSLG